MVCQAPTGVAFPASIAWSKMAKGSLGEARKGFLASVFQSEEGLKETRNHQYLHQIKLSSPLNASRPANRDLGPFDNGRDRIGRGREEDALHGSGLLNALGIELATSILPHPMQAPRSTESRKSGPASSIVVFDRSPFVSEL